VGVQIAERVEGTGKELRASDMVAIAGICAGNWGIGCVCGGNDDVDGCVDELYCTVQFLILASAQSSLGPDENSKIAK
jgi:hypothetical protein